MAAAKKTRDVPVEKKPSPPWEKKNPKRVHKELTDAQKTKAKEAAEAAGRRYPNLVDNMRAASGKL